MPRTYSQTGISIFFSFTTKLTSFVLCIWNVYIRNFDSPLYEIFTKRKRNGIRFTVTSKYNPGFRKNST